MSDSEIKEIQWTIHTTNPDIVQKARASLSEVIDPEIGMNIIQLGLIRDEAFDLAHLATDLRDPLDRLRGVEGDQLQRRCVRCDAVAHAVGEQVVHRLQPAEDPGLHQERCVVAGRQR